MEARLVRLDRAWSWLDGGRSLFMRYPLQLLVLLLLWTLVAILPVTVSVFVIAGSVLLWPLYYAGLFYALDRAGSDGKFRIVDVFRPLTLPGVRFNLMGLALVTAGLYVFLAVSALTMVYGSQFAMESTPGLWDHIGGVMIVLAGLVSLIFLGLIQLLCIFAAPLILFHGSGPIAALSASFTACSRNWQAFLVFGIVLAVVLFGLAVLMLFFGWVAIGAMKASNPLLAMGGVSALAGRPEFLLGAGLVAFLLCGPVLAWIICACYASYRDLFDSTEATRNDPDNGTRPHNVQVAGLKP